MNNYNLAIIGIAEARWMGTGKQRLAEDKKSSGQTDSNHQEGVVLIIASKYANTLSQWKPISEILLCIRLNARHVKLSIIVVYVPNEDADKEYTNDLYYLL